MRYGLVALAALAAAVPALADDSSAAIGMGGIVFTKNTPVRMAAEDLYVSPEAVRIRFEFVNPTARDVKTLVAFPLPDINTTEFANVPLGTVTDDPANFVGFKAIVDGKPVPIASEQRAFVKNKDVTAQLVAAGVPVNPITGGGWEKFYALSKDKQAALAAAGLAELEGENITPLWIVRTKFYWTQVFPAKKTVVIEHSYQPVTGQFFFSTQYNKRTDTSVGDYCFDVRTWATLESKTEKAAQQAGPDATGYLIAYQTDYILKTANNWQGPIGRFHMTLDKLKPDNIISLCWDGELKKTGPTTFEFTKEKFAPNRDIKLIVLENAAPTTE